LVLEFLEGRCVPSTVTNLNDAGVGSLRQAILDTPSGGTVDFQAGLSGTITLTSAELAINKDLTITGSGADVITVSGNGALRVFDIGAAFTVEISGLTIAQGQVSGSTGATGGGINNAGNLTLILCTVSANTATGTGLGFARGGGIENFGTLTITDSTVSGNSASGHTAFGGGIDNGGTAMIIGSTVNANSASAFGHANAGGGISNEGTLTMTNSILSDNRVNDNGGGIYNTGTSTLTGCTLSGNQGFVGNGGGIYNQGTMTLTDSTLSGNATSSGPGGGIYNFSALTFTDCTVSGNSAHSGGGIDNVSPGTANVRNTLLAGNTAPSAPDVAGVLNSQGYNLIGDGTGSSGYVGTDQVGTAGMPIDPMLGPLQNNGGPTPTMALLPGSPALNAGDPTQLGVADQRGVVRRGGVNIGAYQASASAFRLAAPRRVTAGVPFTLTVTAVDPFGQLAAGYTGTVTFATTDPDPRVVLPADYAFTAADGGVHTFTDTGRGETTLWTRGRRTITATDTSDGSIAGRVTVKVRSAGLASPLSEAGTNRSAGPSTQPAQPPARQRSPEPADGRSARSEKGPGSARVVLPWGLWDAVYQGLDDPLVDLPDGPAPVHGSPASGRLQGRKI
jgi:hypothetical protein